MALGAIGTYVAQHGGIAGHCSTCGCRTLGRPGYPKVINHVKHNGVKRHADDLFNWFHGADVVQGIAFKALWLRIWWIARMILRMQTIKRCTRRYIKFWQ